MRYALIPRLRTATDWRWRSAAIDVAVFVVLADCPFADQWMVRRDAAVAFDANPPTLSVKNLGIDDRCRRMFTTKKAKS